MLKHIFLDLDDTILNFTAGEAKALAQALREAGIEPTVAVLDRYHLINIAHWELLEEGRLSREEVLVQRFEQLFRELGISYSGAAVNDRYERLLSRQHAFMPGAEVLLKDGNFLEILPEGSEKKETHNLKGVKIFSFDASKKKQDKFSASDISEIYDRDSSGDGCSKVFIVTKGGVQKALYLYKGV